MADYVVKEKYVKAQEKINKIKQKAAKFWEDHGETACVVIGACIGGCILGIANAKQCEVSYKNGYDKGFEEGRDDVFNDLYLDAAFNGGRNNMIMNNNISGHRLGLMYETLPNKR